MPGCACLRDHVTTGHFTVTPTALLAVAAGVHCTAAEGEGPVCRPDPAGGAGVEGEDGAAAVPGTTSVLLFLSERLHTGPTLAFCMRCQILQSRVMYCAYKAHN